MKRQIAVVIIIILALPVTGLHAQSRAGRLPFRSTCYAGKNVNQIYIPPPKEFLSKSGSKGGATITMYYSGDFSAAAVNAINFSASVLESILPSDTHISVTAIWGAITTSGVLAQAEATDFIPGWEINAQVPYAYYPASLAEKISGKSYTTLSEGGDILLYVNSTVNWYLGTDGKTLSFQYDLATVAMHEIIHGLGFFSSMDVSGSTGSYGISNVPVAFDTFIENLAGKKLTDTLLFANPSAALKAALTSGQVYFDGPLLKNYSGGRAKLYAPTTYDSGSSISHLDENAYSNTVNALMTPAIDMGEAIHNPGQFTMSMLADMGWVNTRITHNQPKDTEDSLSMITLSASVSSDTIYNHNSVTLIWSYNGFSNTDSTVMTSPQSDNNYIATITVPSYDSRLEYYISVMDCFGRVYNLPSYVQKNHFSIYIGTDTVKPVIEHTPLTYFFEGVDTIGFRAAVTDNLAVDTVYVEYKVNDGTVFQMGLYSMGGDMYRNTLNARNLSLSGGDSINYRIVAIDKAASPNKATLPSQGWYSIKIESLNSVASSYQTDFTNASSDFLMDGFSIFKPSGFSSYGLNTPHPYQSPEEDGDSIGYIATLRTPLKFDSNGMTISYKEVVLVEPGESGSTFGSSDFYDYVIVEGSRNFGESWFYLCDGYDSRYWDNWLTAFNSSTDSAGNSTFVPDETLLLKHSIFAKVSGDISAGDTLMVRFRLFSDPYVHGWGWFIENLDIEPLIDQVENITYSSLVMYPNPGNGLITIRDESDAGFGPFAYSVYSSSGTCLITNEFTGGNELIINISNYPAGLYFIILYRSDGVRALKYTLIRK
ncbi:MAG: T9SS type A sorting domain-containing protein [Bacteroidales bacterium]|jgi:hypothetical protein